jgi:hypothetical protein
MKRDAMMDGLLSVLNEDKDENNCSTVMSKLEFTILITPMSLKCCILQSSAL